MMEEIRELGFENVELDSQLKASLLPGVKRAINQKGMRVGSIRAYCPLPLAMAQGGNISYQLCGAGSEKKRALELTQQTIDLARELGTETVVLSLGSLPLKGLTEKLLKMVEGGLINKSDFVRAKLECLQQREKVADKYLARALSTLDRALEYATAHKIKLGVTTHRSYESLPSQAELRLILQKYTGEAFLGYWHDFESAQFKEHLGLLDHDELIAEHADRIVGAYVTDLRWPNQVDQVPFTGIVPFGSLISRLSRNIPYVWRLSERHNEADIMQALPTWKELFRTKQSVPTSHVPC